VANTSYFYRLVATNATGTRAGSVPSTCKHRIVATNSAGTAAGGPHIRDTMTIR
jgi:hypothetical protein